MGNWTKKMSLVWGTISGHGGKAHLASGRCQECRNRTHHQNYVIDDILWLFGFIPFLYLYFEFFLIVVKCTEPQFYHFLRLLTVQFGGTKYFSSDFISPS